MSRKNQRYSKEVKLKAIKMYIEESKSVKEIVEELGLRDKGRVYKWLKLYREKGEVAFDEETRGKFRGARKGRPRTKFDSIEEKMKYLKMENEILKKRLAAKWKGELPKFLK